MSTRGEANYRPELDPAFFGEKGEVEGAPPTAKESADEPPAEGTPRKLRDILSADDDDEMDEEAQAERMAAAKAAKKAKVAEEEGDDDADSEGDTPEYTPEEDAAVDDIRNILAESGLPNESTEDIRDGIKSLRQQASSSAASATQYANLLQSMQAMQGQQGAQRPNPQAMPQGPRERGRLLKKLRELFPEEQADGLGGIFAEILSTWASDQSNHYDQTLVAIEARTNPAARAGFQVLDELARSVAPALNQLPASERLALAKAIGEASEASGGTASPRKAGKSTRTADAGQIDKAKALLAGRRKGQEKSGASPAKAAAGAGKKAQLAKIRDSLSRHPWLADGFEDEEEMVKWFENPQAQVNAILRGKAEAIAKTGGGRLTHADRDRILALGIDVS